MIGYRFRGQKEEIKSKKFNDQPSETGNKRVAKMKMERLREKVDFEDKVKFSLKICET